MDYNDLYKTAFGDPDDSWSEFDIIDRPEAYSWDGFAGGGETVDYGEMRDFLRETSKYIETFIGGGISPGAAKETKAAALIAVDDDVAMVLTSIPITDPPNAHESASPAEASGPTEGGKEMSDFTAKNLSDFAEPAASVAEAAASIPVNFNSYVEKIGRGGEDSEEEYSAEEYEPEYSNSEFDKFVEPGSTTFPINSDDYVEKIGRGGEDSEEEYSAEEYEPEYSNSEFDKFVEPKAADRADFDRFVSPPARTDNVEYFDGGEDDAADSAVLMKNWVM